MPIGNGDIELETAIIELSKDYLVDFQWFRCFFRQASCGLILNFVFLHGKVWTFVNRGSCVVIRRKCRFLIDSSLSRFLTPFGMTTPNYHTSIPPHPDTTLSQMCKFTAPHETRTPIHEPRPQCGAQLLPNKINDLQTNYSYFTFSTAHSPAPALAMKIKPPMRAMFFINAPSCFSSVGGCMTKVTGISQRISPNAARRVL